MQKSSNICCMVHVVLTIPKPSVWSIDNVVNAFPKTIEREQTRLRTVIHFMLGLTMAWFLNAMGPGLPINMWSLTVLSFFFSLIVISIWRSLLDWELSSIWASTSIRVLIEQLWRLVVEYRMRSKHIWMVGLLVQLKLARRSLSLTCIESHYVITKSWRLKDHSRWVFRKNSMEFSVGLDYLLILLLQVAVHY